MFFNGYFTLSILQAADLTDHFNYVELLQHPRYTCNCLCKQCTLRFNYFILGLRVPVFSFVSESLSYTVFWTKSKLENIIQTLNMNVSLFLLVCLFFCHCCCFLSYADLLQLNEILRKLHCIKAAQLNFCIYMQVPRHRLHTTKETIQPNNKAPRRTLLFGFFISYVMTVSAL